MLYGLEDGQHAEFWDWYQVNYPGTAVEFRDYDNVAPVPVGVFVDVSHNNGTMDWQQAKASGVTHAFIKASDGPDWHDPQFATNWQGAKEAGIQRGAYHYMRNYSTPTEQAQSFLATLGDDIGELPPVLDVEEDSPTTASDIWSWLLIVEEALSTKPAIYTAKWIWDKRLDGTVWASDFPLWVANWTDADEPLIPNDWNDYWLWQYSNEGDGIRYGAQKVDIDLNRFR